LNPALLIILSMGHLVTDVSQGALPALNLFLVEKLKLTYFQVGLVSLSFTLCSAFIQPLFGYLSDRRRMTWLLPVSCLASGLGMALTGLAPVYVLLLGAVFLSGLGVAGFHPEGSKTAYYASGRYNRGISMSIFSLGGNLGTGLGPMLAYLLVGSGHLSHTIYLVGPGLVMAVFFGASLRSVNRVITAAGAVSRPSGASAGAIRTPAWPVGLLLGYVTVRAWTQAGMMYYIPFYLTGVAGTTRSSASLTLSAFLIAGALGTILGGLVADRWSGKTGLISSMLLALIFSFLFLNTTGVLNVFAAAFSGLAIISTFPTTVVYGQRLMPDKVGVASGLMLGFAIGMGSVGVLLLGLVADHFGLVSTMHIIALFPLLGLVLSLLLPIPAQEKALLAEKRTKVQPV